MIDVYIESTDVTPLVSLKSTGNCEIEGKAIPEDPIAFFKPMFDWVQQVKIENLVLNINLIYFNTSVSKQLMEFFKKIEASSNINTIKINWHYEEGDEEIKESGEIYEELLDRTTFNFVEYAEIP